jgi:hypothetical protein
MLFGAVVVGIGGRGYVKSEQTKLKTSVLSASLYIYISSFQSSISSFRRCSLEVNLCKTSCIIPITLEYGKS